MVESRFDRARLRAWYLAGLPLACPTPLRIVFIVIGVFALGIGTKSFLLRENGLVAALALGLSASFLLRYLIFPLINVLNMYLGPVKTFNVVQFFDDAGLRTEVSSGEKSTLPYSSIKRIVRLGPWIFLLGQKEVAAVLKDTDFQDTVYLNQLTEFLGQKGIRVEKRV